MHYKYSHWVTLASLAAIAISVLLFFFKVFAWWQTGSVSMLASLIDAIVDIGTSFTNFLIIRYALQPADEEHTFGHGKAESLAMLAQSMFVSGSAFFLLLTGIHHIANPTYMYYPEVGIIVTFLTICITLLLIIFQYWVVHKTSSQAIKAEMLHYQSDMLVSAAILTALWLSYYGWRWADPLFALVIGMWISYRAINIGYEAIQSLLDRALPINEIKTIINIVNTLPLAKGVRKLRTRKSGQTRFIQLHLEMNDEVPLIRAHNFSKEIENKLLECFPNSDIKIYFEPCSNIYHEKNIN
ncbi:MAG: cation diffusion facilitator family transporter [Candidatus Dasytiphilus stammeri]